MAVSTPAIPWYKSDVLRGILTTVVAQVLARIAAQYHIDLTPLGIDADSIVTWLMEAVSAAGLWWAARGRINSSVQPITLTQSAAEVHPATIAATRAEMAANATPPKLSARDGDPKP